MVSKGQKFLLHTEQEKNEILNRYIKGESGYRLAKEYGIPVSTIKTWKTKVDHFEQVTGINVAVNE